MEILCTKRLNNLGIVMGTLKEFGIINLIDQKSGKIIRILSAVVKRDSDKLNRHRFL